MFSIIIPVYNTEKYLDKCLQSVVGQTRGDIEIIVVNNGSPDNSAEIIERYAARDGRIRVVEQENTGLSAARNRGLEIAKKEYVMFVDSDDFIEIDTCERLAKYVEKDKSGVYVFGLYYDCGGKKNVGSQRLRYKKYECGKEYMEAALRENNFRTFAHSKVFRRDLLTAGDDKIRFVDGLLYEDMLFVVEALCRANAVTVVPEYLYHYVQHRSGRITAQHREKDLDVLISVETLDRDYRKTERINEFTCAVLTFRWAASCLIYKYIKGYFSDCRAREVIDRVVKNERFAAAVKFCARARGVPGRDRYLATLLRISPTLYKIAVFCLRGLR
jgi:glycosyltransferase involved in cell wall biosynthesis